MEFAGLQFQLFTNEEVSRYAVANITEPVFYDRQHPKFGGINDLRLGIMNRKYLCSTCHRNIIYCPGHFGDMHLAFPIYHIDYIHVVAKILSLVCYFCSSFLISASELTSKGLPSASAYASASAHDESDEEEESESNEEEESNEDDDEEEMDMDIDIDTRIEEGSTTGRRRTIASTKIYFDPIINWDINYVPFVEEYYRKTLIHLFVREVAFLIARFRSELPEMVMNPIMIALTRTIYESFTKIAELYKAHQKSYSAFRHMAFHLMKSLHVYIEGPPSSGENQLEEDEKFSYQLIQSFLHAILDLPWFPWNYHVSSSSSSNN